MTLATSQWQAGKTTLLSILLGLRVEREAVRMEDPFYALMEAQRQQLKLPFESLTERKEKLRQAGESRSDRGEEGE